VGKETFIKEIKASGQKGNLLIEKIKYLSRLFEI